MGARRWRDLRRPAHDQGPSPASEARWAGLGLGLALALLVGVVTLGIVRDGGRDATGVQASVDAAAALAGTDTAGFARAVEPRTFRFPEDHGAHPEYRTEWWYFTGNVTGEDGRPFAFQLTFFRNALAPEPPERDSDWNTSQIWFAHLAVTDPDAGAHHHFERFGRGALGLAGATTDPVRVWLDDWEAAGDGPALFPLRLRAAERESEGQVGIDLRIGEGKPPVPQGDAGLSRKGPEPGNASYYLSWTRLPVAGVIRTPEGLHEVTGEGWLDREWSTSALSEEHVGWDWFSLQLSSGREIMFYELRRADGTADTLSKGALVEADGSHRVLVLQEVELQVLDRWESPLDGAVYPSGWRISLPGEGIDLRVDPILRGQEMNLAVRYWEGAVRVRGVDRGEPVEGWGFVELTGYARPPG